MDDSPHDISEKLQRLKDVELENTHLLVENQQLRERVQPEDLVAENKQLRETLTFTQRVVEELLSQNKAYYDLLGKRRSSAMCSTSTLKSKALKEEPVVQTFKGGAWIGDIWRSDPDDEPLLGQAEEAWRSGKSQVALNALTGVIQMLHPSREKARIKVHLLSAAIMHHCGNPSKALEVASRCLADASKLQYWDLMGICNFVCGRAQMDLGQYNSARQSFTFAEYTPGYANRVKKFLAKLDDISKPPIEDENVEERALDDKTKKEKAGKEKTAKRKVGKRKTAKEKVIAVNTQPKAPKDDDQLVDEPHDAGKSIVPVMAEPKSNENNAQLADESPNAINSIPPVIAKSRSYKDDNQLVDESLNSVNSFVPVIAEPKSYKDNDQLVDEPL